ncbi:hypothetical protein FEM33_16860 [Dyadobacter flavalbus]|uniref:Uncharacterized protein n=1 Tax=Dyadobacter flavalbus TaxID=2579942 RepID=A0A5M8QU64_9BACT|nr:hypothetical protein [Dyadobacter flavalbus]KAA6438364.1 hypothetical protein FEM33_16860 [Dyadobacter flavalbus]
MASEEPKKTGKINIEVLLGLSATFLSFAALIVSVFQTKIAREQQHASVWPYLSASFSNAEHSYSYNVNNFGIGPAIIRNVSWEMGDSVYSSTFDFIRNEIGFPKGLGRSEMESGYVVPANNGLSLIEVNDNDSLSRIMEKKLTSNSFRLRVIYSDVYGNCWEMGTGKTKPLSECPE